jgi:glycosyltransferase involved in cell wall biosynthesis
VGTVTSQSEAEPKMALRRTAQEGRCGLQVCGAMSTEDTRFMRFTVVTPSFNQLDWLELCIASVADQGRNEGGRCAETKEIFIEHIVCDGGSEGIDDFKGRMLARFPETPHYRLEFLVGPDAGMYDAINKGLRRATGDICSYLNCDEQLLPDALITVGEYLAKHTEMDVVFGDSILVDAQGAALCYWRPYVPTLNHLAGATLNTLSCSTFFRQSMIEAGHLFEPKWKAIGDLQWIRGLLAKGLSMGCLHRPLATFTFLGDNLGASRIAKDEFEMTRTMRRGVRSIFRRGIHFVRKIASGSYMRRQITYQIFSIDNSHRRNRYSHPSLGWTWPCSQR